MEAGGPTYEQAQNVFLTVRRYLRPPRETTSLARACFSIERGTIPAVLTLARQLETRGVPVRTFARYDTVCAFVGGFLGALTAYAQIIGAPVRDIVLATGASAADTDVLLRCYTGSRVEFDTLAALALEYAWLFERDSYELRAGVAAGTVSVAAALAVAAVPAHVTFTALSDRLWTPPRTTKTARRGRRRDTGAESTHGAGDETNDRTRAIHREPTLDDVQWAARTLFEPFLPSVGWARRQRTALCDIAINDVAWYLVDHAQASYTRNGESLFDAILESGVGTRAACIVRFMVLETGVIDYVEDHVRINTQAMLMKKIR